MSYFIIGHTRWYLVIQLSGPVPSALDNAADDDVLLHLSISGKEDYFTTDSFVDFSTRIFIYYHLGIYEKNHLFLKYHCNRTYSYPLNK